MTRSPTGPNATKRARHEMVERQVVARGISHEAVLEAMRDVPREAFIAADLAEFAYVDAPLPIAEGQTISQPYIVALMAEALELKPGDRVLEVGAGSGYAAAILGRVAKRVITVERHRALAESAAAALRGLGYDNVDVHHADGSLGWVDSAPYEAIAVTAAPSRIPQPLLDQLAIGGRLVVPVGEVGDLQTLHRIRRTGPDTLEAEDLGPVQFVPFLAGLGERAAISALAKAATLPERIAAQPRPSTGLTPRTLRL